MNCTKFPNKAASGMCAYSGKPYCAEELVEIYGRLISKDNIEQFLDEQKKINQAIATPSSAAKETPMIFMNAGGGGGGSSSSSSASGNSWLYRSHGFFFHLFMILITGGLWIFWLIIREIFD